MQSKKIKYSEIALIIFVWMVLLFTPILFREDIYSPLKQSVIIQVQFLVPLIILFFINRFILVPKLLFRSKPFSFIISVLGIIVLFTLGTYYYDTKITGIPPQEPALKEGQMITPPYAFPGGADPFGNLRPAQTRQSRPIPPYANFLIFSILIVGFDTGLRSSLRWINSENEKVRLEKENMATQLVLLRNQVSPHFLMNTLNNIHSLVDIDTREAKEAIIKLSKMMRYLLYETETEKTTLIREVEFLESYINLMKLRFNEKVRITFRLPESLPDKTIPPFMFTSLVENAFKHGISYMEESFINITLTTNEDQLHLVIENSKADQNKIREYTGIGIENTRKRLELLFGKRYSLNIIDNKDVFTVNLSVPL
jgi:two-component sensor histidine kinase